MSATGFGRTLGSFIALPPSVSPLLWTTRSPSSVEFLNPVCSFTVSMAFCMEVAGREATSSDEYNPELSTNKRTTGMLGDNGNALMSKKLKLAGVPDDKPKFTDSYNVKKMPEKAKPYNSAWSLF